MITTLTLNPAVDKTFFINDFKIDALNRADKVKFNAGSKGVNISRIMTRLTIDTITTGLSGGYGGEILKNELEKENVRYDFVETNASVRVNTKVADVKNGTFTDINEPGGEIKDEELAQLFDKIMSLAKKSDIFTMGGSIQQNLPKDIYKKIIEMVGHTSVLCGLDCGGEPLRFGLIAKPYFIKPNLLEIEQYEGRKLNGISDVLSVAKAIQKKGIATVLVSLGDNGSVCVCDDGAFRIDPLCVKALGTAGAGDSYFSGFLYGYMKHWKVEDCLKAAASFSSAKVKEEGTEIPSKEKLFQFVDEIIVKRI